MRVALTGGIAEGKSTVLGYLRDLGHEVGSADEVARTVFEDPHVNRQLAEAAGQSQAIDRSTLRLALATDPDLRRRVNEITHPAIIRRLREGNEQFVEIPLLIETCLQGDFDRVWVVTAGEAEQWRRLCERYGNEAHAASIRDSQLKTRTKLPFADRVVRTNDDPESVRRLVSEAVSDLFDRPSGK